jgi:glycerophosphoryl diester phosphodiesterase
VALAALLLLPLALAAVVERPAAGAQVLIAAHRGGALLWPENSLLAFRNALALGVDLLETDVHLTADGEVVVLHDPTLERTTTGRGPVREATLAELAAHRLRTREGTPTDEPIPTLAGLLDLLGPARAELLLEIKAGPGGQRYPGIEEKILGLVRARGLPARTVVMAFQPETVRRVRELEPTIRTALLIGRARGEPERGWPAEFVRRAREVGATHLGLNHRLLDGDVVAAARRAGIAVAAWTVNEEPEMQRVIGLGVDVLITDQPDLARRLLGR